MQRHFIHLAYFGQAYSGWQFQPNAPTVQECLQDAFAVLLRRPVTVVGCGRTDAGVHASSFYAHIDLEPEVDAAWLLEKVNHVLPPDISVMDIRPVPEGSHARFDATLRTYHYHLHTRKDPFLYGRSLRLSWQPDVEAMHRAAQAILEVRDFASFCKAGGAQKTTLCKLHECRWEQSEHRIQFTVSADRFLRNMVRSMVGTFLEVGRGKMSHDEFLAVVAAKDRSQAGTSALADGLFLVDVRYPFL